ncbi:hypothetical protein Glove_51g59 [Diversispora epigaea]|uniref:Dol-P-Glc:Glc(2)Man(9)GlcNAc(2)-PP-Dol alpha-1,2-glucosyltransferase n=1 Tax=Diversispora epigaea TaxID=1348612 RepID=A0A397JFQ6_9GLOM|nr:hypothetical protein Glove_51g59 [Diversispora epigaea]
MATKFILLIAHTASITLIANFIVNKNVPEPYMDEIFHIPQAQNYCKGKYSEWDSNITTPPGLYIISNIILSSLNHLLNSIDFCSVEFLRATNIFFNVGIYMTLWSILTHLHPYQNSNARAMNALILTIFPLNWFLNFLYYTDSGSTFFVLFAYLAALEQKYWKSAVIGGLSVLFRQTNIIWVCFILGISILKVLSDDRNISMRRTLRFSKGNNITLRIAFQEINSFILMMIKNSTQLVSTFFPYLIVIICFLIFLKWNGGIVLGDKSNHIAALHFPQIFYFISFTTIFSAPIIIRYKYFKKSMNFMISRKNLKTKIKLIFLMSIMALLIHFFTYEHPFLLSDNRHYTFYIWKNIYRQQIMIRYILIIGYIFAGWILWDNLAKRQSFMWIFIYFMTTCLVLIPSPLFEFRYFIIPYLLYRLNIRQPTLPRLLLECLLYSFLNYFTLYLFIWKGFSWENQKGKIQRFMWRRQESIRHRSTTTMTTNINTNKNINTNNNCKKRSLSRTFSNKNNNNKNTTLDSDNSDSSDSDVFVKSVVTKKKKNNNNEFPVTDVINYDLNVLFVSLFSGKKSVSTGHHFSSPLNTFYDCLTDSGLTNGVKVNYLDDRRLTRDFKLGIVTLVHRPKHRSKKKISMEEIINAIPNLIKKVTNYRPKFLCFNGKAGYEAFLEYNSRDSKSTTKTIEQKFTNNNIKNNISWGLQSKKINWNDNSNDNKNLGFTRIFVCVPTSGRVEGEGEYNRVDQVKYFKELNELLLFEPQQSQQLEDIEDIDSLEEEEIDELKDIDQFEKKIDQQKDDLVDVDIDNEIFHKEIEQDFMKRKRLNTWNKHNDIDITLGGGNVLNNNNNNNHDKIEKEIDEIIKELQYEMESSSYNLQENNKIHDQFVPSFNNICSLNYNNIDFMKVPSTITAVNDSKEYSWIWKMREEEEMKNVDDDNKLGFKPPESFKAMKY